MSKAWLFIFIHCKSRWINDYKRQIHWNLDSLHFLWFSNRFCFEIVDNTCNARRDLTIGCYYNTSDIFTMWKKHFMKTSIFFQCVKSSISRLNILLDILFTAPCISVLILFYAFVQHISTNWATKRLTVVVIWCFLSDNWNFSWKVIIIISLS